MESLSRCLSCLRLSQTINGQCIFEDCPDSKRVEGRAQLLMGLRGYRIHSGALWLVENDDPEDFMEVKISEWGGSHYEAYENLELHHWPTSAALTCPACGVEWAEDFGGICPSCARENAEFERANV